MHPQGLYEQAPGKNSGSIGANHDSLFSAADSPVSNETPKRFFPFPTRTLHPQEYFES